MVWHRPPYRFLEYAQDHNRGIHPDHRRATMSTAIQAVNLGAYRYIIKTDTLVEELSLTVERTPEELALIEETLRL